MSHFDVALLEWPAGPEAGGPRLLGRISDPDLVNTVRERISALRRRELARLDGPVRVVRNENEKAGTPCQHDTEHRHSGAGKR